jgi:hypothetical protein
VLVGEWAGALMCEHLHLAMQKHTLTHDCQSRVQKLHSCQTSTLCGITWLLVALVHARQMLNPMAPPVTTVASPPTRIIFFGFVMRVSVFGSPHAHKLSRSVTRGCCSTNDCDNAAVQTTHLLTFPWPQTPLPAPAVWVNARCRCPA